MTNRTKGLLVGGLVVIIVVLLIVITTRSSGNYYVTVNELREMGSKAYGEQLTVYGLVEGESITYDTDSAVTEFTMVHITADWDEVVVHQYGLEGVIEEAWEAHEARLNVVYENVKPDMLKHGVQAVVRGKYQSDGTFHADEIILKCPSRYVVMPEQEIPEEAE